MSREGVEKGAYLLPLRATVANNDISPSAKGQVIYYRILVGEIVPETQLDAYAFKVVGYVNTEEMSPLMGTKFYVETFDLDFNTIIQTWIDIEVLRPAALKFDKTTRRAMLDIGPDLQYVLSNRDKYLTPLQKSSRKVLICITGGNTGLGFCNMTDAQIADFAEQVRIFITTYRLDGVNLWDRGSGYGKEGMPAVNTASYPKLIRALRAALPDKMLTVVDYEEPTESFYDTNLTDGIAVGELIDYAWHGYVSENEPIRFINPYNQFTSYEQVYSRKPFAGLEESRYGNVNVPYYSTRSDLYIDMNMDLWSMNLILWNLERQSDIIVFDDLSLPKAMDAESGCIDVIGNIYMYLAYDENFEAPYGYNVMMRIPGIYRQGSKNYDTFAKDW